MIEKLGIWLLVTVAEKLAAKFLSHERGQDRRTKLVDYLITRAIKANKNKTTADNDALMYFSGFLKSERLLKALEKK